MIGASHLPSLLSPGPGPRVLIFSFGSHAYSLNVCLVTALCGQVAGAGGRGECQTRFQVPGAPIITLERPGDGRDRAARAGALCKHRRRPGPKAWAGGGQGSFL